MATICEKKARETWTLFKKWSVVEAFLSSGKDAKEYLENYQKSTGDRIDEQDSIWSPNLVMECERGPS